MGGIRYAAAETEIGPLLVAVGTAGITDVWMGPSLPSLMTAFDAREPGARYDAALEGLALAIWSDPFEVGIPLDMRGTPFQQRVWDGIRTIPRGSVLSYASLAQAIGAPRAVRAVASACGANRIALLVPCHRVVRADGGLGGYRWGPDRKRDLLSREGFLAGQVGKP